MANIANQDHLFIAVGDVSSLIPDEGAVLSAKHKEGTLLDVVLTDDTITAKILAYTVDENGALETVTYFARNEVVYFEV